MADITAIVLTYNEAIHIERCLERLKPCCSRLVVVDSYSTDGTIALAKAMGAEVYQNAWQNNHSIQVNWALENCHIQSTWVLRMDADEYLSQELIQEMKDTLETNQDVDGYMLNRGIVYKNQILKHGDVACTKLIRLWRFGHGTVEQRAMDEHVVIQSGKIKEMKHFLYDHNLNDHAWWKEKHLRYAQREAIDYCLEKKGQLGTEDLSGKISFQAQKKRKLKQSLYNQGPLFIRVILYFLYRFIFKLGLLDGPKGWEFHYKQGAWYRWKVDENIRYLQHLDKKNVNLKDWASQHWKINV